MKALHAKLLVYRQAVQAMRRAEADSQRDPSPSRNLVLRIHNKTVANAAENVALALVDEIGFDLEGCDDTLESDLAASLKVGRL